MQLLGASRPTLLTKFAIFYVTSATKRKVAVATTPCAVTVSDYFGQGRHAHVVTPFTTGIELDLAGHMKMPADVLVSARTLCRTHMQCPACGACAYNSCTSP